MASVLSTKKILVARKQGIKSNTMESFIPNRRISRTKTLFYTKQSRNEMRRVDITNTCQTRPGGFSLITLGHILYVSLGWLVENLTGNYIRKSATVMDEYALKIFTAAFAREDFLVILVGSQMCQSRCHEILVMAPEMRESLLSLNSLLLNWPVLEICNVLCTSRCVVFMMFPSHGTGPWEGAFNQQGK